MLTFVQPLYMVSESVGSVDIEVTKENQVVSEQVLPVSIGLATQGSATQGLKYYIFIHVHTCACLFCKTVGALIMCCSKNIVTQE